MDQKKQLTAVVLAAGVGSRIQDVSSEPKCLLKINGESLLHRHLRIWHQNGISKVNLVLGYQHELILEHIKPFESKFDFHISMNHDYRNLGNTYSLLLGIKDIQGPSLIFDADLIYEDCVLRDFLQSSAESSKILIGEGHIGDIECAKALVDQNNFVRQTIDKRAIEPHELEKHQFAGEAVGILDFSTDHTKKLVEYAEKFLSKKENQPLNWEHLLNIFLLDFDVRAEKIKQGQWLEIDTPEDYQKAQELFNKEKA